MSYDAEWAKKPLTGEVTDLMILQEREQRYLIGVNGRRDQMIIPTAHFCELRDMYKSLIHERNGNPEESEEMSIEQAVAILNPETSREALAAYEDYGGFRSREAGVKACEDACRIAVRAMREKLSADRRKAREESEQ